MINRSCACCSPPLMVTIWSCMRPGTQLSGRAKQDEEKKKRLQPEPGAASTSGMRER